MSEFIRLDLTPEETEMVLDSVLAAATFHGIGPTKEWTVVTKILKARLNPLNGPTFPREPSRGVCLNAGIDETVGGSDPLKAYFHGSNDGREVVIDEDEIPF